MRNVFGNWVINNKQNGASEKQFSLELRIWAWLAGNALIGGASESVKQKKNCNKKTKAKQIK